MLEIDSRTKTITLTRGDTAYIAFNPIIRQSGENRNLVEGDKAYFRLQASEVTEIECTVDVEENKLELLIEPEDTMFITPGTYRYEVELVSANDEHFTIIADRVFNIGKEIEEHD